MKKLTRYERTKRLGGVTKEKNGLWGTDGIYGDREKPKPHLKFTNSTKKNK